MDNSLWVNAASSGLYGVALPKQLLAVANWPSETLVGGAYLLKPVRNQPAPGPEDLWITSGVILPLKDNAHSQPFFNPLPFLFPFSTVVLFWYQSHLPIFFLGFC